MDIIRYILIVVEVLCCLMLIGVILLQQSKSQGMGIAFGGGMSETLFGSRAGNVLTKITVTLGLVFLANTTLLGILYTTRQETSLVEQAPAPMQAPQAVTPAPSTAPELMTATPQQQPMAPVAEAPAVTAIEQAQPPVMTEFPSETVLTTGTAEPVVLETPAPEEATSQEPAQP